MRYVAYEKKESRRAEWGTERERERRERERRERKREEREGSVGLKYHSLRKPCLHSHWVVLISKRLKKTLKMM